MSGTKWITRAEAVTAYDTTMASTGVPRRTGWATESTTEFLARSIKAEDLPAKLDCTTGQVWVDTYELEIIIEMAVLVAVEQSDPHSGTAPGTLTSSSVSQQ